MSRWGVGVAVLALLALAGVELPAGAEPDAAVETTAPQPRTELDLGWEVGPTYRLVQRFPTIRGYDPTGVVQDVRLQGRIGGRAQVSTTVSDEA